MAHALLPLVLFVFTTSLLFETSHGLRIEVNSGGPYSDLLPSEVSISCLTDDEGDDVKEIEILQITRHGDQHWLGYISRKTDHFDTKPGSDIEIHGQVDNKDIKLNYLNLTFTYPKEDDSGTYTCVQFYIDQEQTLLQKKASATLVVDGVSKVLQGLIQKISILEHDLKTALNTECACNDSIAALEETIHKQAKQIENAADKDTLSTVMDSIGALEKQTHENKENITALETVGEHLKEGVTLLEETVTRHSTLIKELEEKQPDKGQACKDCTVGPRIEERLIRLEDMYRNQTQIVTELDNKASYSVAFSASLMDNFVPVEGHVIVFDLPKINQGHGYDQMSGIFTSPADGIYAFQLTGQLHTNDNLSGTVNLGIVVNSIMVAKLILDTENSKQGSVSDVVTLTKGDQVKVITIAVDNKSVERKLALYYNEYTIFSGYLVKQI